MRFHQFDQAGAAERVKVKRRARLLAMHGEEMLLALKLCWVKLEAMHEHFGKRWPMDLAPRNAEKRALEILVKLGE
jgi:hypothetical protein